MCDLFQTAADVVGTLVILGLGAFLLFCAIGIVLEGICGLYYWLYDRIVYWRQDRAAR